MVRTPFHGRPTFVKIPGAGCKKIGRINNLGREESKFFSKKNAKWFFSDNSDPEFAIHVVKCTIKA